VEGGSFPFDISKQMRWLAMATDEAYALHISAARKDLSAVMVLLVLVETVESCADAISANGDLTAVATRPPSHPANLLSMLRTRQPVSAPPCRDALQNRSGAVLSNRAIRPALPTNRRKRFI